ncbi:NACHT domain-containing NTPase [Streptomyces sp. NBC_00140]|uniref:NACHT domain-containing protein n=1 Tax=Streptomyces sp. NBC_00140 TaxID=2975664 RepID=UPI0022533E70|nr:NACHT domain-containing protein [Streptomyces sp. NBC_00140]MCX5336866.1 NACHT domain-containing protein [Streptomyces sp. NBC_00140]
MAGLGGRRRRRNWQMIGAVCALMVVVSTVYAVRAIIHGGLQSADTAGTLGLPLGTAGIALAAVALRKPVEGNDAELARSWAATLASQVGDPEEGEGAVWRQLLGDDTRRINLAYVLHPGRVRPAMAPTAGRLTAGPGPVTLPDIVTYYRSTRPLRLVVTGAPGAGKTVLALELLLALIDGRNEDDPVPVRIPLSRWDTEHQSLTEMLQQRLVEAYDWPKDLAAGLVRHRLVLPVLDGLDEMDPPRPDGSPDPAAPRAAAVIRALNAYQQDRDAGPLILTCRTRHYDALTARNEVLDAARITVAPVNSADAHTYLTDRALDTPRWQPLLDHLAAHPGGTVATIMSTPWRLCLAATVYHHDGNPAELLVLPDAGALDRHLLARYIPAATRTTSNPGYTPQDVHRWLHHLTTHLDPTGTLSAAAPASAEATDLVLHELWPLAGRTRVRTTDALLTALAVLTPLPLVWAVPQPQAIQILLAAMIGACAAVAGVFAITSDKPKSMGNPFKAPRRRKALVFWLVFWLAVGLGLGLAVGLAVGFGLGLGLGLAVGLGFGLTVGLGAGQAPDENLGARSVMRSDALLGLTAGLALGLGLGLALGLMLGLAVGLMLGLAVGLMYGLAATAVASRRYVVFLLCSRRHLPFRLGLFLDWAVTAGLLRNSGPAYQYRHRELQHWLRQHPSPPPIP